MIDPLQYLELAKENLSSDNYLMPIAILSSDNEADSPWMVGIRMDNDQEKMQAMQEVGRLAKKHNMNHVLLINDAAMRKIDSEEDYKEMEKNWDTERPTTYPEGFPGRVEVILMNHIHLQTTKLDTWVLEYARKESGIVYKEAPEFHSSDIKSGETGNVPEAILKAYLA